ncbi:MAG: YceI family protein, partial [Catenulispora sp.]
MSRSVALPAGSPGCPTRSRRVHGRSSQTGSTAAFSVRNMIFKTVQGRFPIESAEVSVDADGVPRSVTATLDAAGFSTDHPKRDTHVRGKDFLHTDA